MPHFYTTTMGGGGVVDYYIQHRTQNIHGCYRSLRLLVVKCLKRKYCRAPYALLDNCYHHIIVAADSQEGACTNYFFSDRYTLEESIPRLLTGTKQYITIQFCEPFPTCTY